MSNLLQVYFYMGRSEGTQAWPARVGGGVAANGLDFENRFAQLLAASPVSVLDIPRWGSLQRAGPVWRVFISSFTKSDLKFQLHSHLACADGFLNPEFPTFPRYPPTPSCFLAFLISSSFGWVTIWAQWMATQMLGEPALNIGHPGEATIC